MAAKKIKILTKVTLNGKQRKIFLGDFFNPDEYATGKTNNTKR